MHTEKQAMTIIKALSSRWLTNLNQSAEDTMRAICAVLLDTTSEEGEAAGHIAVQEQAEAWFAVWATICEVAPDLVEKLQHRPAIDSAVEVIRILAEKRDPMSYPAVVVGLDVRFDQTGRQENVEQNGNDGLIYCECHRCINERDLRGPGGFPLSSCKMILCPTCGNKRCPHAIDHRLECTNSNEPGQVMNELPEGLSWDTAPVWAKVLVGDTTGNVYVWAAAFEDNAKAQAAKNGDGIYTPYFSDYKINTKPAHNWEIIAVRPDNAPAPE